jgi:hypothetical protein
MINKLCKLCINSCRQDDSATIVNCPKFLEKPSDREFREMLDELDTSETKAKKIQIRVKELIHKTIAGTRKDSDNPLPHDTHENG